ncbi:MAG: hypothetical protein AMS18_17510 [Gemmatimonas sp. SG8_17]|nr:MAG: hypothetical protein AMS18_17510 [Gemmatimonas sp. SG8_17]
MGLLLYLSGLLALVSGSTKLRRTIRSGGYKSPYAMAEIGVGATVVLASALGLARSQLASWTVVATFLIILVSSYEHVLRFLRSRRKRLGSESERLERHVGSKLTRRG